MKIQSRDTKEYFEVYKSEMGNDYELRGAIRNLVITKKILNKYLKNGELTVIEK